MAHERFGSAKKKGGYFDMSLWGSGVVISGLGAWSWRPVLQTE